jgi:hypothetical protein
MGTILVEAMHEYARMLGNIADAVNAEFLTLSSFSI